MPETYNLRVGVTGAAGSMGRQVVEAVRSAPDLVLAALIDPSFTAPNAAVSGSAAVPQYPELESAFRNSEIDVVVDFTVAEAAVANVLIALAHRVPAVVGTTGIGETEIEALRRESESSGTPVFIAPNFALGAVLMMLFSEQAAHYLDACEIVELHHDRKLDAPSGTARRTEDMVEAAWRGRGLEKQATIHSVRLPGLVAHQEVIFGATGQTLTIRHDSTSRESFMPGVLLALRRVRDMKGLVLGLENLL